MSNIMEEEVTSNNFRIDSKCYPLLFKIGASLILGVTSAYVFNLSLVETARLDPGSTQILAVVTSFVITVGCLSFKSIRCLALLTAIRGTGPAFRAAALSSLALDLTVAMDDLLESPTATRAEPVHKALYHIPALQEALQALRVDNAEVLGALQKAVSSLKPVEAELTSVEEFTDFTKNHVPTNKIHVYMMRLLERIDGRSMRVERPLKADNAYMTKLILRALDSLKTAQQKCSTELSFLYQDCMLTRGPKELCQALHVDTLCNFTTYADKLTAEVDTAVPVATISGMTALLKSLTPQETQSHSLSPIMTRSNSSRACGMKKHSWLETFISYLSMPMYLVARLTPITILIAVFRAEQYREKYLKDVTHDNIYLTGEFNLIDEERKRAGKPTVLPLNSLEASRLTSRYKVTLDASDIMKILRKEAILVGEFLATLSIWWMGCLVINAASINSNTDARGNSGVEDSCKIVIRGNGLVATQLRFMLDSYVKAVENFKITDELAGDLKNTDDTSDEITYWSKPKSSSYAWICYTIVAVLIVLDSFVLKSPSIICAFFYPDMERKRIQYLYDITLAERSQFKENRETIVKKAALENQDELKLYLMSPLRCACCQTSKDLDSCNGCKMSYCRDCFQEACPVCETDPIDIHPWDE